MRSSLPVRCVEDKDPEYKGLRDNVVGPEICEWRGV